MLICSIAGCLACGQKTLLFQWNMWVAEEETGGEAVEEGRRRPLVDPRICRFLSEVQSETDVAPILEAGVATRCGESWDLRWGSTGCDSIPHFFDLASITKAHFAVCVSKLVRCGVLDWMTTLQEILPEVHDTHAGSQTVEALLSHRAGLLAHLELFRNSWAGAPVRVNELLLRAACAKAQESDDAAFSPVYSDLGYILVGFAIERLKAQALDSTLRETLLTPWDLGSGSARSLMRAHPSFHRRVIPTEIQLPRGGLLRGEVHDDNAWALRGTGLCGHAGLFGTVVDVLRFGTHLLDGVNGRSGDENEALLRPLLKKRVGGTLRMGFDGVAGSASMAGNNAGAETFGHLGFTGTSLFCDPECDRVTVLLCNRVHPGRDNAKIRLVRPKIHDFLWTC